MKKVKQEKLPGTAEALRKRIESWRRTRKPEKLRDAAVAPAAKHGICPISRAVRVDYAALKKRMTGSGEESSRRTFIEVPATAFAPSLGEAVFELIDYTDAKMTVRMNGRVDVDVIAIANASWNRRA